MGEPAPPPAALHAAFEVVQGLEAIVWEADADTGQVTFVSRHAAVLLGHPAAAWHATDSFWHTIVHPDDRPRFDEAAAAARCDGTVRELDHRVLAAGGHTVWLHQKLRGTAPHEAGPRRLRGVATDITARRQADDRQRRVQEQYRLVVESVGQVIFQTDARGMWTFLNPAWTEMTGFTVPESLGRCFLEFVHPDDQERHAELFQPLVSREREYLGREVRYLTKIGSVRWVEVRAQPIRTGTTILGTAGTLTDVTERKHAEEALLETRARLRHLVESSPAVIYSRDVDTGFPFTFVSDNVAHQLGVAPLDLMGDARGWSERIHPDDAAAVIAALDRVLETAPLPQEYRLRHADGSYRWIHDERTVVHDDAGRPIEIVGSWVDVTARQRAEEASAQLETEFRHAQKMEAVGRLAGGVAHDFNNLLTVIIGRCELLFRRLGPGQIDRDIDIIMATARRAASLTSQLLAFSRKQVMQPTVLDLNAVVPAMERMLARLIGEDIHLQTALGRDVPRVLADQGQLEQVIMNLVVNARDAMPAGGRVTIATSGVVVDRAPARRPLGLEPGRYAVVSVTDTGVGIDEAIRAKLFEPFFTTKPAGRGTGLGLSTVYGIVKQSGGDVQVESELGRGATFRILLPAAEAEVQGPAPVEEAGKAPGGWETVLLTEDASVVRDLVTDILRTSGYTVLPAANGEEALAICRRHPGPIHALVTDVVMPQMSGRELAEEAMRLRPDMGVLYVSGYTDDEIIRRGIQKDETMFLAKPFTADALGRKVREVLDRVRA